MFNPSYKKLIIYYNRYKQITNFLTLDLDHGQIMQIKSFKKHIKKLTVKDTNKLNKFISNSILVDDQITNKCINQHFYHINYYHFGMKYDIGMICIYPL